jgi:prepilin-type N-terminal cleavage/methylation domain-containing protein/prepilin-type processing-associated H-X9-DG protein
MKKENIMKRKRGFTLVELLVVIAVIALLMAILMPVLRRAKDQAMRILCGNHIKNLELSLMMYADTHNNKVPQNSLSSTTAWPWDGEKSVTTELLRNMGTDMSAFPNSSLNTALNDVPVQLSTNFYCPANTQQKRYRENYWNFAPTIRVLGYVFMWPDPHWNDIGDNVPGKLPILGDPLNPMLPDPAKNNGSASTGWTGKWVSRTDIPQASETELIVDATPSAFTGAGANHVKYPKGNFASVAGGMIGFGTPDTSNHIVDDTRAAGGNIGFADGHVEWRPFTEMKLRHITSAGGHNSISGDPHWWW